MSGLRECQKSLMRRRVMTFKRPQITSSSLFERKYIIAGEAAKYLRISKERLYNLTHAKKIPHYKFGKNILLKIEDLDSLLVRIEATDNLWPPRIKNSYESKVKSKSTQSNLDVNLELLDRRKKKYSNPQKKHN
jgi:excisionase family DNA binding protein